MRIQQIAVAPVKGLGLNHPDAVELAPTGVPEDRRYALIDARGGLANGKRFGQLVAVRAWCSLDPESLWLTLPDGTCLGGEVVTGEPVDARFYGRPRSARIVLGDYSAALSDLAGEALRLVRLPDGAAIDRVGSGAVSLLTSAALTELGRAAGAAGAVDARRFRMTFTVSGAPAHAEDAWIGRRVRIGTAIVVPEGHIGRCAVTMQDPDTGIADLDTLKAIAEYRNHLETTEKLPFGVHARVVEPGRAGVGDEVVVE